MATSRSIGNIRVGVTADTSQAQKNLASFRKSVSGMGSSIKSSLKGAQAALSKVTIGMGAASGGFKAVIGTIRDTAGEMIEVGDAATQLGSGTEELIRLREVAKQYGMTTSDMQKIINKMVSTVNKANDGSKTQVKLLSDLKLEAGKLKKMRLDTMFVEFATAIAGVKDHSKKAKAMMEAFGTSSAELHTIIGNTTGKLQEQITAVSDEKLYSKETTERLKEFANQMERLNTYFSDIGRGIVISATPAVLEAVEGLQLLWKDVNFQQDKGTVQKWWKRLTKYGAPGMYRDVYAPFVEKQMHKRYFDNVAQSGPGMSPADIAKNDELRRVNTGGSAAFGARGAGAGRKVTGKLEDQNEDQTSVLKSLLKATEGVSNAIAEQGGKIISIPGSAG